MLALRKSCSGFPFIFHKLPINGSKMLKTPLPLHSAPKCPIFIRTFTLTTRESGTPAKAYCFKHFNTRNLIFIRNLKSVASANLGDPSIGNRFKAQDGIPPNYELIYRSSLPKYLRGIQTVNFVFYLLIVGVLIGKMLEDTDKEVQSREERVKQIEQHEKNVKKEMGLDPELKTTFLPKAKFEEAVFDAEDNSIIFMSLGFLMFSIAIGFVKLLNRIPVRIYINPKGHCYGIFYGHVLPFKSTRREFLAGSLTKSKKESMFTSSVYMDHGGKALVLLDNHFRYPSDFTRLLHPSTVKFEIPKSEAKDIKF